MSNVVAIERNGKIVNVPEAELRTGDVLLLHAGDLVAADVKLVETNGLEVDEFDLTGEILPVTKVLTEEDVFVYRGSRVSQGSGKGLIFATGDDTEYGKIINQKWGKTKNTRPPLFKVKYLLLPVLLLPPFIFSLIYSGGVIFASLVLIGASAAVLLLQNSALLKFFLLSSELKKLAKNGIDFNNEPSLADLSETDVVCFDKTGVLTTREITVKSVHFANQSPEMADFSSNEGLFVLTKTAFALCNDVAYLEKLSQADSIDRALIAFAVQNGVDLHQLRRRYKRTFEKPFDSEDRFMAVGFSVDSEKIFFAKGDPAVILKMCKKYVDENGVLKKIDLEFLSSVRAKTSGLTESGDRTIALAYSCSEADQPLEYAFLCLIQFENPLKPSASDVVNRLKEMGIKLYMVTGDRPETALKVSRELGIGKGSDSSLTGNVMDRMDFLEIAKQSGYVSVFSRLLPTHKGTVVRLLQQRNRFVVMVGDGPNDVVALKVAGIGVSFKENSSPFAKRIAKILINDLPDLLTIICSAKRLKQRSKYLMILRVLILVAVYLVLYLHFFSVLSQIL